MLLLLHIRTERRKINQSQLLPKPICIWSRERIELQRLGKDSESIPLNSQDRKVKVLQPRSRNCVSMFVIETMHV